MSAKPTIRDARISYTVPDMTDMPARLDAELTVTHLIFTEGYSGARGETLVRTNRCTEAIRLVRVVTAYDGPAPSGGSHGAEILSTARAAVTASG